MTPDARKYEAGGRLRSCTGGCIRLCCMGCPGGRSSPACSAHPGRALNRHPRRMPIRRYIRVRFGRTCRERIRRPRGRRARPGPAFWGRRAGRLAGHPSGLRYRQSGAMPARGRSSMVERWPSKPSMRVRFPPPASRGSRTEVGTTRSWILTDMRITIDRASGGYRVHVWMLGVTSSCSGATSTPPSRARSARPITSRPHAELRRSRISRLGSPGLGRAGRRSPPLGARAHAIWGIACGHTSLRGRAPRSRAGQPKPTRHEHPPSPPAHARCSGALAAALRDPEDA